jgi:hypothetical protein
MDMGSTQPLTEMSTRNISWGYRRPVSMAGNILIVWYLERLNLLEPSGLLWEFLYFILKNINKILITITLL